MNAPAASTPTCAAGQTGTPPNCVTPSSGSSTDSSGSSGSSGGTNTNSTTTNSVSNVAVPNSTNDPNAPAAIISEEELILASSEVTASSADNTAKAVSAEKSKLRTNITLGAISLSVLAVGAAAYTRLSRRRQLSSFGDHGSNSLFSSSKNNIPDSTSSPALPAQTFQPTQTGQSIEPAKPGNDPEQDTGHTKSPEVTGPNTDEDKIIRPQP